jgi:hypothetical protein
MPKFIPSREEKSIDPNSFYPPGTISHTFKTNFRNADDGRAIVNVYVNGELFMHDIFIPEDGILSFFNLKEADKVHFVRIPTDDEEIIEKLIEEGKLIRHYQYTQTKYFNDIGEEKLYYYFWVRNKITKPNIKDRTMASAFIEREFNNTTIPFFIFQNPLPSKWVHYKHDWKEIPWRMNKLIIKGLRGLVDANKRYVIQFTRDFTLRNKLDYGKTPLELKNLHEQWKLIRKEQNSIIDKYLWDKITESIIEHKIEDKSISVPSYERELYDLKYDAETKYGLEEGQAFANKNLVKETVLNYLKDKNNNFVPIDIHRFFEKHSFDTDKNVIDAMNTIYGTFSFEHVNNLWFSVLYDSMANKHEYPGIMKTSMIAIHSIVILDDQGKFDD